MASVLSRIQILMEANASQYENELRRMRKTSSNVFGDISQNAADASKVVGAVMVAAMGLSIKKAQSFETAMSQVNKTVGFKTVESMQKMRTELEKMSSEIPQSFEQLAAVAATAGELGVAEDKIVGFTETVAKMGVAFGMSSDLAANSMVKIANQLSIPIEKIGDLGDVVNYLSNNMASSAPDIIDFMSRTASLGKIAGLTGEQIAAYGSSMVSLAMTPETAATAFNALILKLANLDGMTDNQYLSFVKLGTSVEDFQAIMAKNPEEAISLFLNSVNKLDQAQKIPVLAEFIGADHAAKIAAMAEGLGTVEKALDLTGKAAGSMEKEFQAISDTSANKMQLFKNNIDILRASLGDALIPSLNQLLASMKPFIESLSAWIKENKELVKIIAITSLTIVGSIIALNALGSAFINIKSAFIAIKAAGVLMSGMFTVLSSATAIWSTITGVATTVGAAFGAVMAFITSPIGLIVIGIGALIAVGILLYKNWDTIKVKAKEIFGSLPEPVQEMGRNIAEAFNFIKGYATVALGYVKNAFTTDFNAIKAISSNVFALIVGSLKIGFENIKAIATAALTIVAVIFNTGFNQIKNVVTTVMNMVKALIRGDMQGVVTAFKTGMDNAWNTVKKGVTDIGTAFSTLGKRLWQIGSDAIQGLINGIKSRLPNVTAVAKSLASSIPDSVKNVLKIFSPSRLMLALGINVGEGLENGIRSKVDDVRNTAKALANAVIEGTKGLDTFSVLGGSVGLILDGIEKDRKALEDTVASLEAGNKNQTVVSKNAKGKNVTKTIKASDSQKLSLDQAKDRLAIFNSGASQVENLVKQIALTGDLTDLDKLNYEMKYGSLVGINAAHKELLISLTKENMQNGINAKDLEEKKKAAEELTKSFETLSESLLTEDEKRIGVLKTQLALIEAMATASEKSLMATKVLNDSSKVTDYSALYKGDTTAGQDNLAKIQQADRDSELEYSRKLATLTALERTAEVQQTINNLESNQAAKRIQISKDEVQAHKSIFDERIELTGQGYATLTSLVKGFTGENSKASKAMFAIQKAHTLAMILLKAKESMAIAWASAPFPKNLGAVAMAALKTGALIAQASGIMPSLSGQAHNGLDYVPKEGTYLLDEGERVIKPTENKKLSQFLDKSEGKGAGNIITTNVTIASDGKADVQSNNAMGKELGNAINAAIQKTLIKELRQGGLLSR